MTHDEGEMSLVGHLTELRSRLIFCIIAVFLFLLIGLLFSKPALELMISPAQSLKLEPEKTELLKFEVQPDNTLKLLGDSRPADPSIIYTNAFTLTWPGDPERGVQPLEMLIGTPMKQKFYYASPIDPFMMRIKVSFLLAIFLSMPVLLYQVWAFVRPGLKKNEGFVVRWLMGGSLVLFPLGAAFAFVIINFLMRMMQTYKVEGIEPLLNFYEYQSILVMFMIVFGFVFMMPLLLAMAAKVGLVSRQTLITYRRHAIVLLAIISMVITPADPFSMFLTLIPLVILYELSIILIRIMGESGNSRNLIDVQTSENPDIDPEGVNDEQEK